MLRCATDESGALGAQHSASSAHYMYHVWSPLLCELSAAKVLPERLKGEWRETEAAPTRSAP